MLAIQKMTWRIIKEAVSLFFSRNKSASLLNVINSKKEIISKARTQTLSLAKGNGVNS